MGSKERRTAPLPCCASLEVETAPGGLGGDPSLGDGTLISSERRTQVARVATALTSAALLWILLAVAAPTPAAAGVDAPAPPSCSGVIEGQGGGDGQHKLTKALVGYSSSGDEVTFVFQLSMGTSLTGKARVRDCAFPDGSNHATFGTDGVVTFRHGTGDVSLTIPADQADGLCDRAAVSSSDQDPAAASQLAGTTRKSNVLCPPRKVVPDVPSPLLLLAVSVVTIALWRLFQHRGRARSRG